MDVPIVSQSLCRYQSQRLPESESESLPAQDNTGAVPLMWRQVENSRKRPLAETVSRYSGWTVTAELSFCTTTGCCVLGYVDTNRQVAVIAIDRDGQIRSASQLTE